MIWYNDVDKINQSNKYKNISKYAIISQLLLSASTMKLLISQKTEINPVIFNITKSKTKTKTINNLHLNSRSNKSFFVSFMKTGGKEAKIPSSFFNFFC